MEIVRLGEVAEINPRKEPSLDGLMTCSFIPMEYVDEYTGAITRYDVRFIHEVEKGYTSFTTNDVLFAKITPCMENGKIALAADLCNDIGFGSTEFHVLRAGKRILSRWIYYFLRQQSVRDFAERNMTGSAGQKRVPTQFMEALDIPLPLLDEQKRIAAILEEADHARRTRRFTQSLSDTFLQEIFVDMFGDPVTNPMGWEWVKVDDIKAHSKYSCVGGPFGSNLIADDYVPLPGIPVIRGTNINSSIFRDSDFVYVSQKKANSLIQNMAYPGDLVFTQRGTLGQIGYIPLEASFDKYIISQSQMKLTPNFEKCDPLYIYQYFLTDYAQNMMQAKALVTGVPHTNLSILKNFPVMLPPLELQIEFSDLVIEYRRTLHQQNESERQTEHLFQTLLHQAFRGEL